MCFCPEGSAYCQENLWWKDIEFFSRIIFCILDCEKKSHLWKPGAYPGPFSPHPTAAENRIWDAGDSGIINIYKYTAGLGDKPDFCCCCLMQEYTQQ